MHLYAIGHILKSDTIVLYYVNVYNFSYNKNFGCQFKNVQRFIVFKHSVRRAKLFDTAAFANSEVILWHIKQVISKFGKHNMP